MQLHKLRAESFSCYLLRHS